MLNCRVYIKIINFRISVVPVSVRLKRFVSQIVLEITILLQMATLHIAHMHTSHTFLTCFTI